MSVRALIRLAVAALLLSGTVSPIVRGQTPPDDPKQAPRPFDKLRVAPSEVEGRQSTGQAMPDFSGRWVLEEMDQPDAPRDFLAGEGYGPPGGGRFGGRPPDEDIDDPARRRAMPPMEKGAVITLTQTETELVVRFGSHERVYRLSTPEGAPAAPEPEKAKRGDEPRKRKSRTYWDGKSLITEIEESFETPDEETVTVSSREVRTLSDEGKKMTVETTLKTPRDTQTITQTFRRRQ